MKIIFALAIFLGALTAFAGADTHGGGVIVRNGNYLTIGSAHVLVESIPQMPEVDFVIQKLAQLDIDPGLKLDLLDSVRITPNRKYYRINKISDIERKKLMDNYSEIIAGMKLGDQIVFAAITDPSSKETYLLPEFDKLPDLISRAVNIFHESLWIAGGEYITLNQVIQLEVAFENYVRCTSACGKVTVDLISLLNKEFGYYKIGYMKELSIAAKYDFKERNLDGLMDQDGMINLYVLLGEEVVSKSKVYEMEYILDRDNFRAHVLELMLKYPKSLLLSLLYDKPDSILLIYLDESCSSRNTTSADVLMLDLIAPYSRIDFINPQYDRAQNRDYYRFTLDKNFKSHKSCKLVNGTLYFHYTRY